VAEAKAGGDTEWEVKATRSQEKQREATREEKQREAKCVLTPDVKM
jgi:hypothetical protein